MSPEDLTPLIKRLRRGPLFEPNADARRGEMGADDIHALLPHRDPFLFVDAIDDVDIGRRTISGRRTIPADDPVFAGHFPANPIYPGVLQVETIGQVALCLAGLGKATRHPANAVATRIHFAMFLAPVGPGDELRVHAEIIEDDGLTAVSAGQIYRDGTLCCCAVQEVFFVD